MNRESPAGMSSVSRSFLMEGRVRAVAFRRFAPLLLILVSFGLCGPLGTATAAEAETASDLDSGADLDKDSRWTPALRVGAGIHVQGLDGRIFGRDALPLLQGPSPLPDDPGTSAVEDFDFSTTSAPGDAATTIEFRFDLRLYAPENLLPLPDKIRPRLFVQMGAEVPLDDGFVAARYDENFDTRVTALYGAALDVSDFCPNTPSTQACNYAARTNFDIIANWSFGVGADFTLPVFENQFHLVPYLGYYGQAYESDSSFVVNLAQSIASSDVKQEISGTSDTEILHGVSAGLGLEVDLYQGDLIALRLFLESRATWILSDREASYDGTNPTPITNFSSADFLIRPSGFIVSQSAGLEVRWIGN